MWDHNGFVVYGRKKIHKGPGLERIMSSHAAYLTGDALPREFWNDSYSTLMSDKSDKLCVAGIEPVGPQRVNLKLVSHPGGESYGYSVIHGYNHVRHCGNMEVYRKEKEEEPFPYNPVTLPNVGEMMELGDHEFIMVYALLMLSYRRSENYNFPIRCWGNCGAAIEHHLDMRKVSGGCYCPVCFPKIVAKQESPSDFLVRAARILPNRPLAVPLWEGGIMDAESRLTRR